MNRQLTAFLLLTWFLLLSAVVMFGQVTSVKRNYGTVSYTDFDYLPGVTRIPQDTLRVRMLVTYKNQNKAIAFSMDGYQVGDVYLDDRKRVIKNLEIWQVKAR